MTITRNKFFVLLFLILGCPFAICKMVWLLRSRTTMGVMEFVGHGNLGSALGISSYPVIAFVVDHDTFHVHGNLNLPLSRGQHVAIRYQKDDPSDTRIDTPLSLWGDTLVYTLGPVLVFIGIFFSPEIIPRNAHVRLGIWPIIRVVDNFGSDE